MKKLRVAVVGYGNVGQAALQAVVSANDIELAGVVRRNIEHIPAELQPYKVVSDIDALPDVDVALLCVPTREVPRYAKALLEKGISTVDSYDIHGGICDLRNELIPIAQAHGAVSIVSAGWDPGSDSVVRCLMKALTPAGITYTNFGPGRSMGHTVAVRAIEGVEDALSLTIPLGTGLHRRMVYVQLKQGYDFEAVREQILQDDYFRHDETHVQQVGSVAELNNVAHSVNIVRNGVSGATHNQQLEFRMSINNPALTGQVMTACARATARLLPGAYTMIEIPPVCFLPGDTEQNIRALV
ncbi:MAG: diaminopimelate dehydrogenase [Paludibacteraceae bacterium]